ncbi:MAG TPA: trypsin-like serine protease [Thermoanaerobaculia bacterium]|nr:trypsin-like serine protease [Thermoanaerobaculia bacterium]
MTMSSRLAVLVLLLASPVFAEPSSTPLRVIDGAHRPGDKIVNGVLEYFQPSVALVRDEVGALCSGALIGCSHLLTAASCFCTDPGSGLLLNGQECAQRSDLLDPSRFEVFFQHGGIVAASAIFVHPDFLFEEGNERNDVAIVRLERPLDGVAPTPINRAQRVPVGSPGTIVGFGRSAGAEDLGLKRSGLVETAACTTVPADQNVCWRFAEPVGAPGLDSNSCDGDAGGPLLVDFGAGPTVAGIISSGTNAECEPEDEAWNTEVFVQQNAIDAVGGADLLRTSCGSLPQVGESGTIVLGQSAELGPTATEQRYSFNVPQGTAVLRVALHGTEFQGSPDPDFDLHMRFGAPAEPGAADCSSAGSGLVEYCEVQVPQPGTWHVLVRRVFGSGRFQITATMFNATPSICTAGPNTLCIDNQPGDNRFQVTASFTTATTGVPASGKAIDLAELGVARGGLFWFFTPDNPEILVKVLDACVPALGNRFWVFLTGGTNVGYEVTVTDTTTGISRGYTNPVGTAAVPVQDINAFACP